MAQRPALTEEQYYKAFGLFIHRFASIEAALHSLCHHLLGLPKRRARIITGGKRLSEVIKICRDTAKARRFPPAKLQDLETIFRHMADIGDLRDALVHRGASVIENKIISSNARTVRFREDTQVLAVNLSHIEAATVDLIGIFLRIVWVMRPRNWKPEHVAEMRQPWLYKPVQPTTPYRRKRGSSPSRRRRRGAFQR